jgi:5'-3' exonuclease
MKVHLVDGTYELFRAHFGAPPATAPDGRPVGAVRGLVQTLLALLRQDDVTHVACAFDTVIESFRNGLFEGYKTGAGVPEELMAQFGPAERATAALGVVVWAMVEFEADDAIATAAERWRHEPGVDQVVVCSPDKDLTQLVTGDAVVCLDRRRNITLDQAGVRDRFGVEPESIPDYLALVGDSADGIPGVPRWGAKSTATVLARYRHIEDIPDDPADWQVTPRGAATMADSLREHAEAVKLYRYLTTLRLDVPLSESLPEVKWQGVNRNEFEALCAEYGLEGLLDAPHRWAV